MDTKIFLLIITILTTVTFLLSCSPMLETDIDYSDMENNEDETTNEEQTEEESAWQDIPLTNINTQATFTIKELTQKPTLIETFAVWCPTCTRQQGIIHELLEEQTLDFNALSLNIDPNEDEVLIQEHIEKNSFEAGTYAISPTTLTQALIDQYGITIASAPQAPIVLICPNGNSELLQNGLKTANELTQALESC
ncbi:TlpA family protein disulfide reductase [archaeon]|jgi:cytochrome oxidase Cu insertion factor (SCO1/SenC/PrrC family)|nr:TlpA family protein disulfide reductase [archaeon]MBT6698365.1 TlpA family protein disulfide reductase [archaeon]